MIDWRRLLHSAEVAEYAGRVGYRPTASEVAWLVWHTENLTLSEKHNAWNSLLQTEPDESIPATRHHGEIKSLHAFLRRFMKLQHKLIEDFYRVGEAAVYSFRICDGGDTSVNAAPIFTTFESAYEAFREQTGGKSCLTYFEKRYMGREDRRISLSLCTDREIIAVNENGYLTCRREQTDLHAVFAEMEQRIPVPFEEGDLLEVRRGAYPILARPHQVFVLTRSSTNAERAYRMCEVANGRTIPDDGYFSMLGGTVYREHVDDFGISLIDCVYLQREPSEEDAILLPISKCLKGDLDLAKLLRVSQYQVLSRIENEKRQHLFLDEYEGSLLPRLTS